MSETMPRHEWWRRAYAENRYMLGLSDDEMVQRFADVMTNQVTLTKEGKIGIAGIEWLEKLTHIDAELEMRGRGWPHSQTLGKRLAIPQAVPSELGDRVRTRYPHGVPNQFAIFKYGKKEHLQDLLRDGYLRLSPASTYNDPSLNTAIADDELRFEKIDGFKRTEYKYRSDYYCFCSSWLHSDRLISDFHATAVLCIKSPQELFLRVATALHHPGYDIRFNRVVYIDPLLLGPNHVTDLAFAKHMRFAYQFEHRWVAVPQSTIKTLNTIELEIGSIKDIAELYVA